MMLRSQYLSQDVYDISRFSPPSFTTYSVSVCVEMVWIRVRHVPANPEVPVRYVLTVKVWGWRRNTEIRV